MKKQIKITALAAAAVLCTSAMAFAAPAQLNVYGASAQGDFWVAEALPFLQSLGCKQSDGIAALNSTNTGTGKVAFTGSGTKVTYSYTEGYNCSDTAVPLDAADGKRNIIIRTGGIASLEGPLAVKLLAPLETEAAAGCAPGSRLLPTNTTIAALSDLACYPVVVGTTDLKVENINQKANDELGNAYFMPDTSNFGGGLTATQTLAVPFAFAVNTGVKARHCYDTVTASTVATKLSGFYCTDDNQCGAPATGHTRTCKATSETIDNITRAQAVQIFSGKVTNWQDLDKGFDSLATAVCLRVPGSGTHAALEKVVMTAGDTGWGAKLVGDNLPPSVDYRKTSDNMVECINGGTSDAGSVVGAIGYLDADKDLKTKTGLVKVNYNGAFPSRINVRKGVYDYYTIGQMYINPTTVNDTVGNLAVYNKLAAFIVNPLNIPGTVVMTGSGTGSTSASPYLLTATAGSKATWWATLAEMKFVRSTDLKYPAKVTPTKYVNP